MTRIAFLACLPALALFAQQPKFEIADVHVSKSPRNMVQSFGGILRGGRYINRDATMLALVGAAYGVTEEDIAGGPGWVASDLFDVIAKVPDGTKLATANLMLKSLLAERFGLVVKQEDRPVPRYVLTVAKGGPKIKTASGSGDPSCRPVQPAAQPASNDPASAPNIHVECRNLTAAQIADNLHQMAGGYLTHDVVDSTKLDGTYDFDLEWTGLGLLAAKGADGISVFDAVDKQLGLKLELQNISMPALAIVKVNRKPTDNAPGVAEQVSEAPPRFEAASIKPADPDNRMTGLLYTGGSQMQSGGTLRQLIAMSLNVLPNVANDLVTGLPKSADSTRWSILAKVPTTGSGAPNKDAAGRLVPPPLSIGLQMLYNLLVDRFELKYHTENREVTVYALVLGNGKPKMTQADESERSGCKPDAAAPKPAPSINIMIACKNTTMTELAQNLQQQANAYMDHPVVDATGLTGGWNYVIGWTPRGLLQGAAAPNANQQPNGMQQASDPSGGLSVFDAVERELGLKLVKQVKSVQVIVVDHVDEKPIE